MTFAFVCYAEARRACSPHGRVYGQCATYEQLRRYILSDAREGRFQTLITNPCEFAQNLRDDGFHVLDNGSTLIVDWTVDNDLPKRNYISPVQSE